jgi:hypothetical protein
MAVGTTSSVPYEIRGKGLTLATSLDAIARLCGDDARAATIAGLSILEARDTVQSGRLQPSAFYPIAWQRDIHTSAQRVTARGRELSRAIGYEGMRQDLLGIHRVIRTLLSPETLVRLGGRMWTSYFSGGHVALPICSPGLIRAEFSACHGFDRNLWENIVGSCQAVVESAGGSDVELSTLRGGADSPSMVVEARWLVA